MSTITGKVYDAENGLPLWLAHVVTRTDTGAIHEGTVTDTNGAFVLGQYDGREIHVSFVGYRAHSFTPGSTDLVNVYMERSSVELPEVVITPDGPAVIPPDVEVPDGATDEPSAPPVTNGRTLGLALLLALGVALAVDN